MRHTVYLSGINLQNYLDFYKKSYCTLIAIQIDEVVKTLYFLINTCPYNFRGEDFRPAYKDVLHMRSMFVDVPVLAATATCDEKVRKIHFHIIGS